MSEPVLGDAAALLGGRDEDVALIEASSGAKVTYGELRARVARAAAKLRRDAEGDVAFVFARNDVATVVELLGGFAARVPVALFDPRMADDVMDDLRRRYRPGTIRGVRKPAPLAPGAVPVKARPFDSGRADARPSLRANGAGGPASEPSPAAASGSTSASGSGTASDSDTGTGAGTGTGTDSATPFALSEARSGESKGRAPTDATATPFALSEARSGESKGRAPTDAPSAPTPAMHPDLGLLLSTSGSTGSPKLVRLARTAVIANARSIAAALELGPAEVAPTSLPIHYSYGLSVLTSHLVAGATVLLTDDGLLTDGFWTACRTHRVTSLAGVPYSYLMLRRIDLDRVAPPTLRTFTQAGGRLDPTLVRHYAQKAVARGGRFYVMYGQTEATARIAVLPPSELPARAGSVGRAIPGGELTIDDGEVVYRGPNVMMGYALERADLARPDELAGELRTGDLGHLDDDGFLWITGRSRRIAKVFGLRVNLDELEALGRAAAPGLDLAAIGDSDRVVVFVTTAPATAPAPETLATIRTAIVGRLGIHPTGVLVTACEALPRLPSGKIDYRALNVPS